MDHELLNIANLSDHDVLNAFQQNRKKAKKIETDRRLLIEEMEKRKLIAPGMIWEKEKLGR